MSTPLAAKLGYRGGPAAIIDPPPGYDPGIVLSAPADGPPAFVQVFVTTLEGLRERVWPLLAQAGADPVLWVCYPKRAAGVPTDLNRDIVFGAVGEETEFRVVSNVAIDAAWSALRLRRKSLVRERS